MITLQILIPMSKLMTNIGENYEYLRVIVQNQIEIKKLELLESTSKVLAFGMLALILFIFVLLITFSLSILTINLLISYLGSSTLAHLTFIGIILLLSFILIFFRKKMIFNPVINLFYSSFKNSI